MKMLTLSIVLLLSHTALGLSSFFYDLMGLNFTCTEDNNLYNQCVNASKWWGPTALEATQDKTIRSFNITFNETMIADLQSRLQNHRTFRAPLEGINFEYGFNTTVLANWTTYWAESYPFKEREAYLNNYPTYKTNIQGLDIFFVRVTPTVPEGKTLVPMLLIHGFPGSFIEFYEAISYLTAADDSRDFVLELIIPSLPGFGYSDSAVRPGLGAAQAAVILRNLMNRLGFTQYYVQGGDLGSITGTILATIYPAEVLGLHINSPMIWNPLGEMMHVVGSIYPPLVVDPVFSSRMYPYIEYMFDTVKSIGYLHHQATKPDTIGVGIGQSPAALMAWNLYNFNSGMGTYNASNGLNALSQDSFIDHLMMYWAPKAVTTSFRYYAETFNKAHWNLGFEFLRCLVPTWVIQPLKGGLYYSTPFLKMRYPFLMNSTAIETGAHFYAFETPEAFSTDVLTAVGVFRKFEANPEAYEDYLVKEYYWTVDVDDMSTALGNITNNVDVQWAMNVLDYSFQAFLHIAKHVLGVENLVTELLG